MIAPRSISRVASAAAIACWWLFGAAAAADSILAGTVTDAVTHQPIVGAQVDIEYSGQMVGSGTSDVDGLYKVPFTIPPSAPSLVIMIASAHSQSYEINRSNFQVNAGTPVETAHNISLFPRGVMACLSQAEHPVIVGHFLSPLGRDFSNLPDRVALSMDRALNTRLQTVHLPPELQPSFEPCDAAKPKTPRLGPNFAKALRADAFIGGDVAEEPPHFTVSTYLSDAYDFFSSPEIAISRSVDLNNPSGASMAAEMHVAVLAAIASGLARKNDCVTAITVLSVAEQLINVVPSYIAALRKDCEARLPNAGLTKASP